jgi:hypothetical protein
MLRDLVNLPVSAAPSTNCQPTTVLTALVLLPSSFTGCLHEGLLRQVNGPAQCCCLVESLLIFTLRNTVSNQTSTSLHQQQQWGTQGQDVIAEK